MKVKVRKAPEKQVEISEYAKAQGEGGRDAVDALKQRKLDEEQDRRKRETTYKLDDPDKARNPSYDEIRDTPDVDRMENEDKYAYRQRIIDTAKQRKDASQEPGIARETLRKLPSPVKKKPKPEDEDLW